MFTSFKTNTFTHIMIAFVVMASVTESTPFYRPSDLSLSQQSVPTKDHRLSMAEFQKVFPELTSQEVTLNRMLERNHFSTFVKKPLEIASFYRGAYA